MLLTEALNCSDVTTFPSNVERALPLCFAAVGLIVSGTRGANVCLKEPHLRLNQRFRGVH